MSNYTICDFLNLFLAKYQNRIEYKTDFPRDLLHFHIIQ